VPWKNRQHRPCCEEPELDDKSIEREARENVSHEESHPKNELKKGAIRNIWPAV